MNKAELVAAVAEKTGFTKKDAELAVNAFVSSVELSLIHIQMCIRDRSYTADLVSDRLDR